MFKARVIYEVYEGGRLVRREVSPDPFVRNWVEIMRGLLNPNYEASFYDIATRQTIRTKILHPLDLVSPLGIMDVMAEKGMSDYGIVVGNAKGSKDFGRYALVSAMVHQDKVFEYGAMEDLGFDVVAGNFVWRIRRTFDNVGTSPVDIWESAVYALFYHYRPGGRPLEVALIMIALDVRDTVFRLEAGQRGVVTYEFTYFMPSGWTV